MTMKKKRLISILIVIATMKTKRIFLRRLINKVQSIVIKIEILLLKALQRYLINTFNQNDIQKFKAQNPFAVEQLIG